MRTSNSFEFHLVSAFEHPVSAEILALKKTANEMFLIASDQLQ